MIWEWYRYHLSWLTSFHHCYFYSRVCLDFLSVLASNAVQCVKKSSLFLLFIAIGLSCKEYEMHFLSFFIILFI